MVRRSGSNVPQSGVQPPELYQTAGENYARIRQNTMSNFDAARQATAGVAQANAANTQADLARLREMENFRAAQIQAQNFNNQQSGGVAQGIGQVVQGLVGGYAAQQELKSKQEQAMYERQLKERKMSLDERKFAYQVQSEQEEYLLKNHEERLGLMGKALETSVGELETRLVAQVSNMSRQEGMSYAINEFSQMEKEYKGLFSQYPEIGIQYRQAKTKVLNGLWKDVGENFEKQISQEVHRASVQKITEFKASFTPLVAQIPYITNSQEAQKYTTDIINQAISLAQGDESFMQTVKRNPEAWNSYMDEVVKSVMGAYEKGAASNAAAFAEAQRIGQFAKMFDGQDMTDPTVRGAASEWLAANGMPQSLVYNPDKFPTTNVESARQQVAYLDNLEKLAASQRSNDPMFQKGSKEHEMVFKANAAQIIYDVANGSKDRNYMENYIRSKAEEAERYGSSDSVYWKSLQDRFKDWDKDSLQYQNLKDQYNKAVQKYDQMYGKFNEGDTQVISDPLTNRATRVNVEGEAKAPSVTQFQLDKQKVLVEDLAKQTERLNMKWQRYGLNIEDPTDPTYLNHIQRQAEPVKKAIEKRLLQSGHRVDNEEYVYEYSDQTPSSGSRVRSGVPQSPQSNVPINFTGGRERNENVVRGLRGVPTLPNNKAQNTPTLPLSQNLAKLDGVGWSPFVDGSPRLLKPEADEYTKAITMSGGNRVATLQGGEVIWSGQAGDMGNVVLIKNGDGLTEVLYNLGRVSVKKGQYVNPAQSVGTSNAGKLKMELWASTNPLNSLWTGEGRNQQDPLAYMQQFNATVPLERGVGVVDAQDFGSHQPTRGGIVYQNPNYVVSNGYIFDRHSGKTRKLTVDEFDSFYPEGLKRPEVVNETGESVGYDQTHDVKPMKYVDKKAEASWYTKEPVVKELPEKFVFAAGHNNTLGQGAPKEAAFTPIVTRAIVQEGLKRGYDVRLLETSGKSLGSVASEMGGLRRQGYFPMEIHGDAADNSGRSGVILGSMSQYSEAERRLAQEFGGYDYQMHEGKLAMRSQGVPLLEVGSMSMFQDEATWEEASEELARRYWDSIEKGGTPKAQAGYAGYKSPNDIPNFRPEAKPNTSRMVGNRNVGRGISGAISDAQSNKRLVADRTIDPRLAAALDTVAWTEGTAGELGYQTTFAHRNAFPNGSWTPHPRKRISAGGYSSDATGRYQFLGTSWEAVWGGQNQEMNPTAQDRAAVKEMERVGAAKHFLDGNVEEGLRNAGRSWVSIISDVSADAKQGKVPISVAKAYYRERLKIYQKLRGTQGKDPRTSITNTPLKKAYASGKKYNYRYAKPSANANFGYTQLANNEYARKSLYSASVKTGIPQQWLADIFMSSPNSWGKLETEIVSKVAEYRKVGRINTIEDAAHALLGEREISKLGKGAGREYKPTEKRRTSWHTNPRSTCTMCQSMLRSGRFTPHQR